MVVLILGYALVKSGIINELLTLVNLFTHNFLFLYRALLYGGMKESQLCEIELKDTPLTAFKHLLRYIYMGHMTLGNQKDELILEILGLAHKYGFQDLESSISDYLKAVLSIKNVCLIYDTASLYGLEKLMHSCCFFMDRHAVEVLHYSIYINP